VQLKGGLRLASLLIVGEGMLNLHRSASLVGEKLSMLVSSPQIPAARYAGKLPRS